MSVDSGRSSIEERNVAIVYEVVEELWNKASWATAERHFAPDMVVYMPTTEPLQGRDQFRGLYELLRAAFPDLRYTMRDVIAEGDRVAARCTHTGTSMGPFLGFPATGRSFEVEEMFFYRFEDGLCVEMWPMPNLIGQMQQIGLVPSGPPPRLLKLALRARHFRARRKLSRAKLDARDG